MSVSFHLTGPLFHMGTPKHLTQKTLRLLL